jgi:ribosomal protein S18 acetylase RimI-like enzyme
MSNSSQLLIRQAIKKDLKDLLHFSHAIHQHEDEQLLTMHPHFLERLKTWLLDMLNNPLALFLIAEYNKSTIGFIGGITHINDNGFLVEPSKGVIHLLWVEKNYRRHHIGQKLLMNMEACFKELGINITECSFTHQNKEAIVFWNKMGYNQHSITAIKVSQTKKV